MISTLRNSGAIYCLLLIILTNICCSTMYAVVDEKPIVVVIPSYNNKKWYRYNLDTLFRQNYTNYRVIYIDDCSKDGTGKKVKAHVKDRYPDKNFQLIQNSKNFGALKNLFMAINSCDDDEIIITYDGDDWFPSTDILQTINEVYQSDEVWLTYGTYIGFPSNQTSGHSKPFSKEIIENNLFRKQTHPSHLRTFYAWLFKKIDVNDLLWNGEFFPMAWDLAMMFPMIEMAGERHKLITKVTYVYNQLNPISDNKKNLKLQKKLDQYIRALPRYKRLENRCSSPSYDD